MMLISRYGGPPMNNTILRKTKVEGNKDLGALEF
jgi:hypothetical protein